MSEKKSISLNICMCSNWLYTLYLFRFVSKVTFQDHINRRAILMKYDCSECNLILTFYNRCALLLHARTHFSLSEGKIDLGKIEILHLPFGMMGFLPHPGITKLFDVKEDEIEENFYINTQFYSPENCDKGKQIITLLPNDLLFCGVGENSVMIQLTLKQISKNIPLCQFVTTDCQKKLKETFLSSENSSKVKLEIFEHTENSQCNEYKLAENSIQIPVISKIESLGARDLSAYPKCPECNKTQRCSMKMHFIGKNIPIDEKLKCSLCKYVSSTDCSHTAHERIHSNISPFICPECGKKFESREYLMKHLDDVCFHLAKQVRIRCPGKKCGKLFASTTTFSFHFTQHIHTWMQCTVCKECFESIIAFSEHAKIHSNLCFSDKVFKCLGCKNDGSMIYQDNVKQHLDFHTNDRSRYMYVFVCKFCRNYFRSTVTYAAHLQKCQKMQAMVKQGYSYSVDFCVQCHNRIIFYDNENFVACTKCRCINSFNPNNVNETMCNNQLSIRNNDEHKIKICFLCKDDNINKNHILTCPYRNTEIKMKSQEFEISRNLLLSSDISTDSSVEYENDETSDRKSRAENEIKDALMEHNETKSDIKILINNQETLKRKRKRAQLVFRPRKIILSSVPDTVADLQAEMAKSFNGTYYCKMCDLKETDRDKFHLHIKTHRDISTDYQCMDCGECFVVKPSLIKHLKHFHKIEDTNSYLENNDCYDKNAVEELKEILKLTPDECRESVKENQCGVCLQEFSDDVALETHIKKHI